MDLVPEEERDERFEKMKSQVVEFFAKRKIKVKEFHRTCAESLEGMQDYNDTVAEMLLKIATNN